MTSRLLSIIERFSQQTIVVVGDLIADEFVFGEIARVSREAPVLILRHERTETMPGGAGNTASNIASLGGNAASIGVVGRDRAGRMLTLSLRSRGINTAGVLSVSGYVTPTKTRILAGSAHAPRQQVIRVDREDNGPLPEHARGWVLARLEAQLRQATGVILSDYNYGLIDSDCIALLQNWQTHHPAIPIVVDSRFRLHQFTGFTSATPNEAEAEDLCGQRFTTSELARVQVERLRSELNLKALLLTRGPEGMILVEEGRPAVFEEAIGSKEPVDVTGAGDTVIATYTTALAAGATFSEAMHLANCAAGCVVMKRGTATMSQAELVEKLRE